jgi:ElaB/YqjD/DUF883 family membrane-anchored ribosome-binding protein
MNQEEPRSPEEIRRDIEETRGDLGDTAEALAQKTDVKGRAKARVEGLKRTAQQRKDELTAKAKDAAPDSASAGAQQAASTVKENPVPLALVGAFVAGIVVGRIISR